MRTKSFDELFDTLAKCNVCANPILIASSFGGSKEACKRCGWKQERDDFDYAESVRYPNLVSLDRAKLLYAKGRKLSPNFEEFLDAFRSYGEMEFWYRDKRYGLTKPRDKYEFFEVDAIPYQAFDTIDEFVESAHINGILVKDIWDKVEKPYWLT